MNFSLAPWCDSRGALDDGAARHAAAELEWSLTSLTAAEPVAIDLRGVSSVSDAFVSTFLVPLLEVPPEASVGRCPLIAFGASPELAAALRNSLATRGLGLPIATAS